jgi:hypothetical protein
MPEDNVKLIEYKKQSDKILELMGESNMDHMRTNHAYEGRMNLIDEIESGTHIKFVKKKDIQMFIEGKNEITTYSVKMQENYSRGHCLAHCIGSYANGLLIDEIKSILNDYHNEEYVILSLVKFGQFFEYTCFREGEDYAFENSEQGNVYVTTVFFLNSEMKEDFVYVLNRSLSIAAVQNEINKLKISKDVLFVHHAEGVGYASRDMKKLKHIAGYTYQNYIIEN